MNSDNYRISENDNIEYMCAKLCELIKIQLIKALKELSERFCHPINDNIIINEDAENLSVTEHKKK